MASQNSSRDDTIRETTPTQYNRQNSRNQLSTVWKKDQQTGVSSNVASTQLEGDSIFINQLNFSNLHPEMQNVAIEDQSPRNITKIIKKQDSYTTDMMNQIYNQ